MDKVNLGRLSAALDKLKHCADRGGSNPQLTRGECKELCAYIWWLTDQIAAKAKDVQDARR